MMGMLLLALVGCGPRPVDVWIPSAEATGVAVERAPVLPRRTPAHLVVWRGGDLWMAEDTDPALLATWVAAAPAPRSLSDAGDVWWQPLPQVASEGVAVTVVDAASGGVRHCLTGASALLTLGTPPDGWAEEGPMEAPVCGEPARFTQLVCEGPVQGGVLVGTSGAVRPYTPLGAAPPPLVAAASAQVQRWSGYPAEASGQASTDTDAGEERGTEVTLWRSGRRTVAAVKAFVRTGDVCGGDHQSFLAVFEVKDGRLGRMLVPWWAGAWADVAGLVDLGADGVPEVVVDELPGQLSVIDANGAERARFEPAFCACMC